MSRSVFDPEAGKPEPIWLPIEMDALKQGLSNWFIQGMRGHEDALRFIVSMDLAMADWDFTEKLIAHFKALELEFEKEEPGSTPIEPKKINP